MYHEVDENTSPMEMSHLNSENEERAERQDIGMLEFSDIWMFSKAYISLK